jgi:predicted deacylase
MSSTVQEAFELDGVSVQPGTRVDHVLPVGTRLDNTAFGIPVIVLHGAESGPTLLIDGATHGDELEALLALHQVCSTVDPAGMKGTLLAVPSVNFLALEAMSRFTPRGVLGDPFSTDLNRVFPGRLDGSLTERIAANYAERVISRANFMITTHGAGNSFMGPPKVLYDDYGDSMGKANRELAEAMGWPVLWRNKGGYEFKGTSSGVAHSMGIPAVVPEHGGSDRMPERYGTYVGNFANGFKNVMRHLGMISGEVATPDRFLVCEDDTHVHVDRDGLVRFVDGVTLGTEVEEGQHVASLYAVFGKEVAKIEAPWSGTILLIRTYPVLKTGDWILSITRDGSYETSAIAATGG